MPSPKSPKKSESLEIRIPHTTKLAFMARCRAQGRSASEALRDFIDAQLDETSGQPAPRPVVAASRKGWRLLVGALIAAAIGAVAVPSLARPSPLAAFERLDANGDGRISRAELANAFSRLDTDRDGAISFEEYQRGVLTGR